MTSIAVVCNSALIQTIDRIPKVRGRVFSVRSEDELIERVKGIGYPCVGIAYDGILPSADSSSRTGVSAEVFFSVMVFFRVNLAAFSVPQEESLLVLDTIRNSLLGELSPTGHVWRFKAEVPVESKKGLLTYVQRWSTPCQLAHSG